MKFVSKMKLIVILATMTSVTPSFAGFTYDFPGCEGGGGSWWPSQIKINDDVCSNYNPYNFYTLSGHCNGRLVLEVKCTDGEAKSVVEINDCYCD